MVKDEAASAAEQDALDAEGDALTAYIDANVIVYAGGRVHPYREPCRRILDAIRDRRLDATTSLETVLEILDLYVGRGERPRAVEVAEGTLDLFATMLAADLQDVRRAMALLSEVPRLAARDAVHAAICLRHEFVLVSADRDFDDVRGLRRVAPDRAIEELVN